MAIIEESVILRMGMDTGTDGGAAGADSTLADSSLGPLTQDRSAPHSWLMESTNARATRDPTTITPGHDIIIKGEVCDVHCQSY